MIDEQKFNQAIEDKKEELLPFFEDLEKVGSSIFDTSRIWETERELETDDGSFQNEIFDYLQEKYNCIIESYSTDMGSFVVIHDDWYFDENGNTLKKVTN